MDGHTFNKAAFSLEYYFATEKAVPRGMCDI